MPWNSILFLISACLFAGSAFTQAQQPTSLPRNVDQLLVGITRTWDSQKALFWAFERTRNGWSPAFSGPKQVLLGRNGLAWGRGLLPVPTSGHQKREGDGRTPAGLFAIGKIYGYPGSLPQGARFPYRQITQWDCWVDDVNNPYYNQHVVVKPGNVPSWYQSQRMRHGDHAYTYRIEVRHNSDPPVPGKGSAIFFHYRRGPDRPTAGCTAMAESDLHEVIRFLRADRNPHYVILPQAEYDRLQPTWNLPAFR